MSEVPRKKSPRAPSMPLPEAIEKALRIYDKEHRHAAPTDVIAQNIGYKSANNGSALTAIASLRSYGLLEKAHEGKLAVSKSVESYKFAPSEDLKSKLQFSWLKNPAVFAELLEKYSTGLPSDATIRFDLIQSGFAPGTAESVLNVFKQSVEFTKYFEGRHATLAHSLPEESAERALSTDSVVASSSVVERIEEPATTPSSSHDRIPVRLSGGRRAWLEIPSPFFNADKRRLKAQIDLLLAEDDDESSSEQ